MDIRKANFQDLLAFYYIDLPAQKAARYLMAEIAGNHHAQLAELLRDYRQRAICADEEIEMRAAVDALLICYNVMEIASTADFIPAPDTEKPFWKESQSILENQQVRKYYEIIYPTKLPQLLRLRFVGRHPAHEMKSPASVTLMTRFLDLDRRFMTSLNDSNLLRMLDSFIIDGYGFSDVVGLLENPATFMRRILLPPKKRDVRDQALVDFSNFMQFCFDLDRLLEDADGFPLLQSEFWHHYSYWFSLLGDKLRNQLVAALNQFSKWTPPADAHELSARGFYIANAGRVLEKLTSDDYSRPVDELLTPTPIRRSFMQDTEKKSTASNASPVAAILDFTLEARGLLEKEVSEQLEGIYGLLPNAEFADPKNYPALKQLPEAKETRQRLEQYIADQQAAGLTAKDAHDKLAKEAAFTWLNRLVAFKMMEGRKLVRQTITKGSESNAFKLWLAEDANAQELALYNQGDLPANAVGEGPRPRAYRHFLLWQCGQLAQEIKVLFDADNLPSRFFPRPNALTTLIGLLNDAVLADAWLPGNEETIGWVYQFFQAKEKKDVFDRLYKKKQKIRREDIPAATELFTPRWIVTWLVHNSLGRLWLEMHPDSTIAGKLKYLVPLQGDAPKTPVKLARDIALLDPACGTMHFGLVAFDVFQEMYQEELANAGKPGWLAEASVASAKEIPASIIAHNLFGIDLDLRAIQLSALCLYLKAKTANKDAVITNSHLACADISHLDDAKFEAFLKQMKLTDSIYARLLKGLWVQLKDIDQIGSLLRLEEQLGKLIAQEREKFKAAKEKPHLPGFAAEQFETKAGELEFWQIIESQIISAFQMFAQQQAEHGRDESLFTGEATKGLQILDLMMRRYDVVAANPPYMSRRSMNTVLTEFLDSAYPDAKGDLYTAFIQRCGELLNETGHLGMITQQSFMFISSYETMRKNLRDEMLIHTMAHLGPRAFDAISGEKVNTTMFVLRQEADARGRNESVGTYFRLVKEPDGDSKRTRFEQALAQLHAGQPDPNVFHYRQHDFDAIPGSPWVYWITGELRKLFETLPSLASVGEPVHGTCTYDNFRFVRFWWEAGTGGIHHAKSWEDFEKVGRNHVPYMKGGDFCRWYGNQEFVLQLLAKGRAFKEFLVQKRDQLRGESVIFTRGVTYSFLTSAKFSARLSPGGFIFDVAGSSLFPSDIELVLAVLNSEFVAYALRLINPTVNCQVGDLIRLPVPNHSSKTLHNLVEQAVALAKTESQWNETTYDLISPPSWASGLADAGKRVEHLAEVEQEINEEVYRLYEIAPADRAAIERELREYMPAGDGGADTEATGTEEAEAETAALTKGDLAYRWASYAVGIVLGRFEPGAANGLGRGAFDKKTTEQLRALSDADGILVADEGHPDDLTAKVWEVLKVIPGETAAVEVVAALTDTPSLQPATAPAALREWLDRKFFKAHIQQYRKRPVYWLLQSPDRSYGVWLFHERLTKDTLFRIRTEYVEIKRKSVNSQITDVQKKRAGATGRDRSRLDKELAGLQELAADLAEFDAKLKAVSDAGYIPRIDDGVLLNMCPLWELVPSWQKELKAAWQELEKGEYDWAHHAMDYWPDRVKKACKTNKSFAIAHGLA